MLIFRKVKTGSVVTSGHVLMSLTPTEKTQLMVQVDEKIPFAQARTARQGIHGSNGRGIFQCRNEFVSPVINKVLGYAEVKLNVDFVPDYKRNDMHVLVDFLMD